ncbi:MAG: PilZ domain-containing protein [Candidatus Acidiferrales bacterium]
MSHIGLRSRLTPAERRRSPRIRLQIPVFIRSRDASGTEFLDLTKTLDISATGAFIASTRALRTDHAVFLTIPAPRLSSSGLVPLETPPIQARVRRQHAAGDVHLVGLEFLKSLD